MGLVEKLQGMGLAAAGGMTQITIPFKGGVVQVEMTGA